MCDSDRKQDNRQRLFDYQFIYMNYNLRVMVVTNLRKSVSNSLKQALFFLCSPVKIDGEPCLAFRNDEVKLLLF